MTNPTKGTSAGAIWRDFGNATVTSVIIFNPIYQISVQGLRGKLGWCAVAIWTIVTQ